MSAAPVLHITRTRGLRGKDRFGESLWRSTAPDRRADLARAADRWGDRRLVAALERVPRTVRGEVLRHLAGASEASGHVVLRLACAGAFDVLDPDISQAVLLFFEGPASPGLAVRWREGTLRVSKGLLQQSFSPRASAEGLAAKVVEVMSTPRVPLYVLEAEGPWPRGVVSFGPPEARASPSVGEWRAGRAPVLRAPDPCVEAGWPDVHPIARAAHVGVRFVLTCAEAAQVVQWLDHDLAARHPAGAPRLMHRARALVGASSGQVGEPVRFRPGR